MTTPRKTKLRLSVVECIDERTLKIGGVNTGGSTAVVTLVDLDIHDLLYLHREVSKALQKSASVRIRELGLISQGIANDSRAITSTPLPENLSRWLGSINR